MRPIAVSSLVSQGDFIRFHSDQSSNQDEHALILEIDTPRIPSDDHSKMVTFINNVHNAVSKAFQDRNSGESPQM